ncbi:hypothetical protein F4677DRAFT_446474 [Hypoxylon crocopeplum]|nr:hypothetical protein F4677DRAFT_446474 [Hypoxylon crocopeplum]
MVNPRRAAYLTVNSSLEFLNRVLPPEFTTRNAWVDEEILRTEVLIADELPHDHRPDERFMASRLQVPNELRLRITNSIRRNPKSSLVATDMNGKPLVGLVNFAPGSEELEDSAGYYSCAVMSFGI